MLLIHICSISVIAWELDTNLKIVRADCQFEGEWRDNPTTWGPLHKAKGNPGARLRFHYPWMPLSPFYWRVFLLGLGLSIIASLSCYSDLTRNLGIKWSFLQLFELRHAIGVLCSPKVLVKYALPNADQAISDLMLGFSSQDNGPSIFLAPFQATRDGERY